MQVNLQDLPPEMLFIGVAFLVLVLVSAIGGGGKSGGTGGGRSSGRGGGFGGGFGSGDSGGMGGINH